MSEEFWAKNPSGFRIIVGRNLEMPLAAQTDYLTPNDRFFVCNQRATPRVDAATYRLRIQGDAVSRPLGISYEELKAMPQRSVLAYLECAGNHRLLFEKELGRKLNKRPHLTEVMWDLGAIGMAEWRGVPLRHVLELAGLKLDAIHVCPVGLDRDREGKEGVKCPMPIGKALDPDTLLALRMNGEQLPPDHGFPVRVIVPGWIGTYSIKWVDKIEVSSRFQWVVRNTEKYVLMGDEWPEEDYAPAKGGPITQQNIKSSLALDWPARWSAGTKRLFGYARSPDAEIASVEWSDDMGKTWHPADIMPPNLRYSWARFTFEWVATPGVHELMTRATDARGAVQPLRIPFNNGGYMFNMVHRHPVQVSLGLDSE
ncbi:sulfite oxidase [Bradyrhizobium mercantei]|uniref:sulfite oxidase n=1 Tax=Bradyrhizobium mercantei TaxID=1904807 RepID=UPI000977A12E|nr:sulfite oxidase [Bradyrhizobium mercantei]